MDNNYLKNAEMLIEDNYNSIDGIINNVTPKDKLAEDIRKDEEKREKNNRLPLSAEQIRSNAAIIANTSTNNTTKVTAKEEKTL